MGLRRKEEYKQKPGSPKGREYINIYIKAYRLAQAVNNPSATQNTQVQSLSWEEALEKLRATHSSILTWKIPWTEEPGGLQSMGSQESDMI